MRRTEKRFWHTMPVNGLTVRSSRSPDVFQAGAGDAPTIVAENVFHRAVCFGPMLPRTRGLGDHVRAALGALGTAGAHIAAAT